MSLHFNWFNKRDFMDAIEQERSLLIYMKSTTSLNNKCFYPFFPVRIKETLLSVSFYFQRQFHIISAFYLFYQMIITAVTGGTALITIIQMRGKIFLV